MKYPVVIPEWSTLAALLLGKSISRFGDGEFKLVDGREYVREPRNAKLTAEIRSVLYDPTPDLIVGIPTMNPNGPKYEATWARHKERFTKLIAPSKIGQFYSAFISRPDSAPWINTPQFAVEFQHLWRDRRVALVCEKNGSAYRCIKLAARELHHIRCPSHGAYELIDAFEREIAQYRPEIAFLSCGVSATCLAARLARRGIQAIDFGSGGSFLAKLLQQ